MSMDVMCTPTEEEGAKPGTSQKYIAMLADLEAQAEIHAGMVTESEFFGHSSN